jgi:glutaredoxin/uncharacterized damage-inducible protein DinB
MSTTEATTEQTSTIELYWLPGCSSCMRMKEFVQRSGVEFTAINAEADERGADKLRRHELHAPAACVGDRCVDGHHLDQVADLLGIPYEQPVMLSPYELHIRYGSINEALCRFLGQMPLGADEYRLPGRRRSMLDLANHTSLVARAFLKAFHENKHDTSIYKRLSPVSGFPEVIAMAEKTRHLMDTWWDEDGQDDPLDRVVESYGGYQTLHQVLERETWHTAQHSRQLQYVLELHGVQPDGPLTDDVLKGLPVPAGIHE